MKNISLLMKVIHYFTFSQELDKIKNELLIKFNAKVDKISRIYTVLNIDPKITTPDVIDETVKDYLKKMTAFLDSKNLRELVTVYDIKSLDNENHLVVLGYALFNTKKIANNLVKVITSIIIIVCLCFLKIKM